MIDLRLATQGDAEPLAVLHAASLPSSLLTALGDAALARYYAFVQASPNELVWAAHDGTAVVGGCVLSHAPATLLNRFARHAPFQLARELAGRALRDRGLRRRLASRLRDPATGESQPHSPEVTQIFAAAQLRGRGIGAHLLRTCEGALRARGVRKYLVHTQRDDNDAGIRFYLREGFVAAGESRSFGEAFLVMQKVLD